MNHRPVRRVTGAVTALLIAVVALGACEAAPPDTYVAIGDSYTSGPGISNQIAGPIDDANGDLGSPAGCLRSDRNFSQVARSTLAADGIDFGRFWDFSCSGAQTGDFFEPQSTSDGTNIPQLGAVGSASKVVTIGIGGNDIGFSSIVTSCIAFQNCVNKYVHDGVDDLRNRIDALAPTIGEVIQIVHDRAPHAKVFVVGYPTIVPKTVGTFGCQTMTQSSVTYLDGIEQYLNAMLKTQAEANDAVFVDTYTSSQGHDACASTPWVNGLIAIPPVHPNAAGMAHTGALVAAAIEAELQS